MAGRANPRFEKALSFAAQAHGAARQERKGTDFPYVSHPMRVAEILDRFGCSDDAIVAGFLHDTIEDANVTVDEISAAFSLRVAALVAAVSEPDKSLPWKKRKEQTIAHLQREDDPDVQALVAADKLESVRSTTDTLRHLGQVRTWALFNAKRSDQHWYYRRVAEILLEKDAKSRLFRTLDFETQTLFPDPRHPTTFFAGKPLGTPHDARAYLADPIKHWVLITQRSSWLPAGSELEAFRGGWRRCSRPATPTRTAGSSRPSSSERSTWVRRGGRARPTCSRSFNSRTATA